VNSNRTVSIDRHDRAFYASIAIALALTVFVGFGPTYYFHINSPSPMTTLSGGPVTLLVHVHAMLFAAWVLLFIVQATLVAQRKINLHRRLGIAGGALAALMVVLGTLTALKMVARGSAPRGTDPLQFLMIPLSDMALFAGFIAAALIRRRDREAHKRLMLLAYVCIVVAAVARLPGVLQFGPPVFFGLAFVFVLAGVIYDMTSRGRVHPVYIWGGTLWVISVPVRLVIAATDEWKAFARWAIDFV
jgi:uncharacterized membrane protein YozB (DUF420 family)